MSCILLTKIENDENEMRIIMNVTDRCIHLLIKEDCSLCTSRKRKEVVVVYRPRFVKDDEDKWVKVGIKRTLKFVDKY